MANPQIVSWHSSNHMRLAFKARVLVFQLSPSRVNVRHEEIQNRAGVVEFRLLGPVEHEPYPATIEERKARRRLEQQLQAKYVLIESRGPLYLLNVDGNLTQL